MKKVIAALLLLVSVAHGATHADLMAAKADMCISIADLMKTIAIARDQDKPLEPIIATIRKNFGSIPNIGAQISPFIERMARAVYVTDVPPLRVGGTALDECMKGMPEL